MHDIAKNRGQDLVLKTTRAKCKQQRICKQEASYDPRSANKHHNKFPDSTYNKTPKKVRRVAHTTPESKGPSRARSGMDPVMQSWNHGDPWTVTVGKASS